MEFFSLSVTHSRSRKLANSVIVALTSLFFVSCAAQGPPRPPRIEQPERITDLSVAQVGRSLEITFTPPRNAADGERLSKPIEIEIFRATTVPGETARNNPAALSPWMTLRPSDLTQHTRGDKVALGSQFSEEEFSRLRGATLTFWVGALTRGFRRRPIRSESSQPAQMTLLNVSDPVRKLHIVPHEKALELRWSPPEGRQQEIERGPGTFAGYRVYKSNTGAPDSFELLAETQSPTYSDRDFEFNRTYFFKVRAAFRKGGQVAESEDSETQITPRDIFPPEAPAGLSGLYTGSTVDLIWTANSEPDLAGYNIYRREATGPASRINKAPVRTPLFRDSDVQPQHNYLYYVTALDLSNNESRPSREIVVETR